MDKPKSTKHKKSLWEIDMRRGRKSVLDRLKAHSGKEPIAHLGSILAKADSINSASGLVSAATNGKVQVQSLSIAGIIRKGIKDKLINPNSHMASLVKPKGRKGKSGLLDFLKENHKGKPVDLPCVPVMHRHIGIRRRTGSHCRSDHKLQSRYSPHPFRYVF